MTALLALTTRLALAKVALVVPAGFSDVDTLGPVIDAGADLLILDGSGDVDNDVEVLRAVRRRWGTTPLLVGTSSKRVAGPASADVVHLARPGWRFWGYPKGHEWSLLGRHAIDSTVVAAPGDDFDYLFVGPLEGSNEEILATAVEHQPPLVSGSVPWFAWGDFRSDDVAACLSAGARRIALTGDVWDRGAAARLVQETVGAVTRAWSADERSTAYRAAAFRL
ncbi:MAG: hypothetical protein Q4P15_01715 [Propionibacteriaceae bacterium]|nr:hypothetical protein [Propionibacteriaceae bacterium]